MSGCLDKLDQTMTFYFIVLAAQCHSSLPAAGSSQAWPERSSWMQCLKKLVRAEGVRSLYYSFPTTLFMNLPYGGVMVATNETLKSYFNPSGGQNAPAFFTRFALMTARSFL